MKKKIVSILLCAAMVATMAIGCGKKEAASDEADASKDGGLIKVGIITILTNPDIVQQMTKI